MISMQVSACVYIYMSVIRTFISYTYLHLCTYLCIHTRILCIHVHVHVTHLTYTVIYTHTYTHIPYQPLFTGSGQIIPIYDKDLCLLYLYTKGECNIKYYDIPYNSNTIHNIGEFKSNNTNKSICIMPKAGLNVMKNEIGRFYKLTTNNTNNNNTTTISTNSTNISNSIEYLSVLLPRRSNVFQSDIYPDVYTDLKPPHNLKTWYV